MIEHQTDQEFWTMVADNCERAAAAFPVLHPDANFFRLAQQIAEEQAGLRKRPAGLMQWAGSSDAPSSP